MIDGFEYFRDINITSIFLRMTCTMICGGIIGTEREYKRRSAGFRTHILICLGACIAALTGQYLCINLHYTTDMGRLGAQVVAGIGFIGAGAIILTQKNQVRGLTTSAGLWAASMMGLAFGSGFYEGGFITTVLILASEILFSKYEYWIRANSRKNILYLEFTGKETLNKIQNYLRENNIKIENIELSRTGEVNSDKKKLSCVYIYLRSPKKKDLEIMSYLRDIPEIEDMELW